MPFTVTVNTQKRKWLKKELDMRKATYHGMDTIAIKTADYLRMNIERYGLIWKQRLLNSIKVDRVKKSEIHIKTIFYGPIIETGHPIRGGVRIPMLIAWARDKMGERATDWLAGVYERGYYVKPRPFISDSLKSIDPQVPKLVVLKIGKVR